MARRRPLPRAADAARPDHPRRRTGPTPVAGGCRGLRNLSSSGSFERGYDIIDRFEGRSSLRTYLTVVISRMLLDWRNSKYGKWRPSKAALSLGEHAVDLERLMSRDGYTADVLPRPSG